MKLVFQRGACGNGRTCPNLNTTDRGSYVIQGYVTSGQSADPAEASIEVPLSLLPELHTASDRDGLCRTDRGSVILTGQQVTDPDALDELNLPAGENAIEVPLSLLTKETTHAG